MIQAPKYRDLNAEAHVLFDTSKLSRRRGLTVQNFEKSYLKRVAGAEIAMKILIVEDDQDVGQTLKLLLKRYAYASDWVTDGETGLQMLAAFDYDLLLLDILLPGINGVELCQQVRHRGMQTPILLLTGRDGGAAKAEALNAGADDYVVKPFHVEELIARVNALLRRCHPFLPSQLVWGKLWIDSSRCLAAYGSHVLTLTPKEYAILELLLRNQQRPLSAATLLNHAWDSEAVPGEETVRGHIKMLRKKLSEVSAPSDLIKTIHRVGYQLNDSYQEAAAENELGPISSIESART